MKISKRKVLELLKDAIKNFDEINKIELVATFGSITKVEKRHFDDIDIIMLSDKKIHDEFVLHLEQKFTMIGLEPVVFETITKKPNKKKDQIFIHDLNYSNLSDLLKREWKSIINTMKLEMVVLHGDKNFQKRLPFYKISKAELLNPIIKWSKNIKSVDGFTIFQMYLGKIIPKLLINYKYLDLDCLKTIKKIIVRKFYWKDKLAEIIITLLQA